MNPTRIQDLAKPYLEYDMIRHHTDLPAFPDYRSRLLVAFLNKEPGRERTSELYALATSLVQMALDTHEEIPVSSAKKDKVSARARQLKVLAGDYFSSKFYNLLAQAGEIDVIKQVALSICEVNRLKMNLYLLMKQLKMTADDYLQQTVAIKMQLFLSFQKRMSGMAERLWPDMLQTLTRCEVLLQEIFRLESPDRLEGSWAFWHIMQTGSTDDRKQLQADEPDLGKLKLLLLKYNVGSQLYQMLEGQVQLLRKGIRQLNAEEHNPDLESIGEHLMRYVTKTKALGVCPTEA